MRRTAFGSLGVQLWCCHLQTVSGSPSTPQRLQTCVPFTSRFGTLAGSTSGSSWSAHSSKVQLWQLSSSSSSNATLCGLNSTQRTSNSTCLLRQVKPSLHNQRCRPAAVTVQADTVVADRLLQLPTCEASNVGTKSTVFASRSCSSMSSATDASRHSVYLAQHCTTHKARQAA